MTRPQLCAATVCTNTGSRQYNRLIQCYGGCDKNFHWKCVGLTAAGSTALKDNAGMFWFCDDCRNNSLLRVHRKLDYLYESAEATRILLRRVETNLESKLETCYNMIHNLAKVHTLSNATLNACSSDQTPAALDLSIHSNDLPPGSAANSNGKRKHSEDDDDDVNVDDEATVDDAILEGPPKRTRNQPSPSADIVDLADLPTPTFAYTAASSTSSDVAAASLVDADLTPQAADPVVATSSDSTGNYTSSICPAEAGHGTAPSFSDSRPPDYFIRLDDDGNVIERIFLAPVDLPTYGTPASETSVHSMDTSSDPLDLHPPNDVPAQPAAANEILTCTPEQPAQLTFTGQSAAPPTAQMPSAAPPTAQMPSTSTYPGNARTGVCPAEASATAASSKGLQFVPEYTTCQPAVSGSPTSSICSEQLQDPRASLMTWPGNTVPGICPAEVTVPAAPSVRFQLVPVNTFNQPTLRSSLPFNPNINNSWRLPTLPLSAPSSFPPVITCRQPGVGLSSCYTARPPLLIPTTSTNQMPSIRQPHASLTSRPGNARTGICLAEAPGTSAPSRPFQPIPGIRSGSSVAFGPHSTSAAATNNFMLSGPLVPNRNDSLTSLTLRPVFHFGATPNQPNREYQPKFRQSSVATSCLRTISSGASHNTTSRVPLWTDPPTVNAARSRNPKRTRQNLPSLLPPVHSVPQLSASTPFLAPPTQQTAPTLSCKHFYVKPFDPATPADDIARYIQSKTGWGFDEFCCQRLTSDTRSAINR